MPRTAPAPGRTVQPLEAFRGSIGGEHWSTPHILRELMPSQSGCCGTPAESFVIATPETNGWALLMKWATTHAAEVTP